MDAELAAIIAETQREYEEASPEHSKNDNKHDEKKDSMMGSENNASRDRGDMST